MPQTYVQWKISNFIWLIITYKVSLSTQSFNKGYFCGIIDSPLNTSKCFGVKFKIKMKRVVLRFFSLWKYGFLALLCLFFFVFHKTPPSCLDSNLQFEKESGLWVHKMSREMQWINQRVFKSLAESESSLQFTQLLHCR